MSGGRANRAAYRYSSVSGGYGGVVSGRYGSVSGARYNIAGPNAFTSVSGGYMRSAGGTDDWAAGSLLEGY